MEAHQQRKTNGDVGISREVCIDLKGIKEEGSKVLKAREEQRVGKDAVDEVQSQIVAQDNLFRQASKYHEDGKTEHPSAQEVASVELRDEIARFDDRACNKLREEADVEAKVEDISDGTDESAIHIGCVADDLEGIERNAYGQDDAVHAEDGTACCDVKAFGGDVPDLYVYAEDLPDDVGKEVAVLEIAEDAEVEGNAKGEPKPPLPQFAAGIDTLGDEEVAASHQEQKSNKQAACLVIEEQTNCHQISVAHEGALLHIGKASEDDAKEHPEMHLCEEQRTVLVEGEDIQQIGYE